MFTLLLALCAAIPAHAQSPVQRANALLESGRVIAAESLYYDAVRLAPRDPHARLALGKYLASRGALKIGVVLMEEARFFGGDAKLIAEGLVPVYHRLSDFRSLAALPGSPLSRSEMMRAAWLRDNAPNSSGPDSTVVKWMSAGTGFGQVVLALGSDTVTAIIDPGVQGLMLESGWRHRPIVRVFPSEPRADAGSMTAVTNTVRLGEITLHNVITRIEPGASRIGLGVLAHLAPTFDAAAGTITLRKSGKLASRPSGERVLTVVNTGGTWLVQNQSLVAINSPVARQMLGKRWTLNTRRGETIVNRDQ
ncbi:MAG: hypothetical protein ACR2G6_02760 [Gemmatimonadaceae bacterium]